ncbi:hypothetical protein OXX80_004708 [Metschnikowia pulcherrima]
MVHGETIQPSSKESANTDRNDVQNLATPRAKKVKSSSKLMSEEDGPEEDECHLRANSIESENVIEVKDETPAEPETPKKRGRGRPKKGESPKKPVDLTPRRSGRRLELDKRKEEEMKTEMEERRKEQELEQKRSEEKAREAKMELEAHNAMRILEGLEPIAIDDQNEESPASPKKTPLSPRKPQTPKKRKMDLLGSPSPRSSIERRSKKGRPSRQENVTKQVVSIFQMDDHEIFAEKKAATPSEKGDTPAPNDSSPVSLNFENKGQSTFSRTPTISGIRRELPKPIETDAPEVKTFTPFPVPDIDGEGNLTDPNFIKTHLSDVAASFDPNARLTDERAFFLEGSEGYFEQHSLRFRPSTNSLASNAPALDYDEFIPMSTLGSFIHKDEKSALQAYQEGLFHQWCYVLSQGFNLNLFGIGSKASTIMKFIEGFFVDWYSETIKDDEQIPGVLVINGYNPSTKLKRVIHDIVSVVVSEEEKTDKTFRMPKHVSEAFPFLMSYLKKNVCQSKKNDLVKPRLILVVHNIDGEAFRDERSQNFLSQLASLPNVWLIVSTDNINVGLLWDLYRFKNFNFIWHELTTYEPYGVEMSFKDVLSMGKSKKFVGSKGAKYVLASLTTNARDLYKTLLKLQMQKLEEMITSKATRVGLRANAKFSLELKNLYDKCVQEYIVSNEINFNTLLREFVEHKMCSLARNLAGQDIVFVPFTYDEMEKLMQEEF